MSQTPVSVCLLAYNHAKTLEDALESVLSQSHSNFELIVSDDCSTDGSWAVIERVAQRDRRIRPLKTPRNLGMAGNANFAIAHAAAPFVALLHHDDVCASTLLSRWLQVAESHPSVAFVSNAFAFDDGRIDFHPFQECTSGKRALEEVIFPRWGCPIRGTALIRKSCWDTVGGMRERFGLIADVDLWMRLAARWDVGYVREPLIRVRHESTEDYPADYRGWSWSRARLLYEIHGANRADYFEGTLRRPLEMATFRWRVSLDELRWLLYAVAKGRHDMLRGSAEVANSYEYAVARVARRILANLSRRSPSGAPS